MEKLCFYSLTRTQYLIVHSLPEIGTFIVFLDSFNGKLEQFCLQIAKLYCLYRYNLLYLVSMRSFQYVLLSFCPLLHNSNKRQSKGCKGFKINIINFALFFRANIYSMFTSTHPPTNIVCRLVKPLLFEKAGRRLVNGFQYPYFCVTQQHYTT